VSAERRVSRAARLRGHLRAAVPLVIVCVAALIAVRGEGQEADPGRAGEVGAPGPIQVAIARVAPSVVRVDLVEGRPLGDAPRRRFFRPVQNRQEGAGIVVDRRLVLTHAALALYEEPTFSITTASGSQLQARLRYLDRGRELALLETQEPIDAPAARTAPSTELRVGNLVLALGDPFGMARDAQAAASLGVLEGRVRLDALDTAFEGEALLTDAAINPGSEGGPLIDLEGRVVGVLAPLAQDRRLLPQRGSLQEGSLSGYAIPIEEALIVMAAARRARPGARLAFSGRVGERGVEVVRVDEGGPSAKAGLLAGDVVLRVGEMPVKSGADVREALSALEDARAVTLTVERAGQTLTLELEFGEAW